MPRPLFTLVLGAMVVVAVRLWVGPHVVDDAYITFRYAENIASGTGFIYNAQEHVLGTSAPLLALLLAVAAAAGANLSWVALTLSAAADVVTVFAVGALLTRADRPAAAMLFGLLLAFWPGFVTYSVSGLETSLFVALHAAAFWAVQASRGAAAGSLAGAAVLCRPDGAWLAAITLLSLSTRDRPAALRAAAGVIVVLLPWTIFSLWYFGSVVPASVTAKAQTRLLPEQSLVSLVDWFWRREYVVLTPLAVAGLWDVLRRSSGMPLRWWAAWWVGYAAVYVITGAFGPYRWYFVPLLPLYGAGLCAAIDRIGAFAAARARVTPQSVAYGAAIAIVALGAFRLPGLVASLDTAAGHRERLYRTVAEEVLQPQDCTLAATEIGALGYHYRGPVLDLVGLVSPDVLGRSTLESLLVHRPCWIVTYDDLLQTGVRTDARFRDAYREVWARRAGAQRNLLVFGLAEVPQGAPVSFPSAPPQRRR